MEYNGIIGPTMLSIYLPIVCGCRQNRMEDELFIGGTASMNGQWLGNSDSRLILADWPMWLWSWSIVIDESIGGNGSVCRRSCSNALHAMPIMWYILFMQSSAVFLMPHRSMRMIWGFFIGVDERLTPPHHWCTKPTELCIALKLWQSAIITALRCDVEAHQ